MLSDPLVLAFETSTATGGVALVSKKGVLAEELSSQQKLHSELLHKQIFFCLKKAGKSLSDVTHFAVDRGPGSFTGIRVSGNTGKTLSWILNKPLVMVDSLRVLAQQNKGLKLPILCMVNAYKNMVYWCKYDADGTPITSPSVIQVQSLEEIVDRPMICIGDGWLAYQQFFPPAIRIHLIRPDRPFD
ncbi:MAG: tRNA (adenosine(37)-N6)-threonylcarbamoyltransferase complex dimerization subunit type 1 TsaB [Bdellovibrionaceae bacterium]|nr:tRNA (adenosine(37)-N6)-threonylcarbamoyltransferase complex dimerization subunit type 1 TsaB [Pseudobdellovibrionaceae bacterium]